MAVDSPPRNALAGWRQVPVQELVLPVVIVALLVAGAIIKPDVFPTSDNLLNVLTQASITGIIAIGMTFVIATGGIDLSVGSVLAAASIAGGLVFENGSWIFILAAVGFAVLLERSTAWPSPGAGSSPSSPPWPCSPSPAASRSG